MANGTKGLVLRSGGLEKAYRSPNGFVMQRERDTKTPNGRPMGGKWVLRNPKGELLDFDVSRNSLAERHCMSLEVDMIPTRRRASDLPRPTPDEVRRARLAAGLTQAQAAQVISPGVGPAGYRTWQRYEAPAGSAGHRDIPPSTWAMFLLETEQHPDLWLKD